MIRLFVFFTFVTGFIYPFFITGIALLVFPHQSGGSILFSEGKPIGSVHIGQKFEKESYFWGRPSASNYDTLPSSGSNLSPTSKKLKEQVDQRIAHLQTAHGKLPPADLVFASASGIDPDITVESALYQLDRIAKARNLTEAQIKNIREVITTRPYVNVLQINLTLDQLKKDDSKTITR